MKIPTIISRNKSSFASMFLLSFVFSFCSCIRNMPVQDSIALSDNTITAGQQEIDFAEMINNAKFDVNITPGAAFTSYIATATGRGKIRSGEYAEKSFYIRIRAEYSSIGDGTLTTGQAVLQIGNNENFKSITSPAFGTSYSFCCGSGNLLHTGGVWVFRVGGEMRHRTAATPHNHLFVADVSTAGTIAMNVSDQSGTTVTPVKPPHDPGIGLISGIKAKPVSVTTR